MLPNRFFYVSLNRTLALTVVIVAMMSSSVAQQQSFDDVKMVTTDLGQGLYMIVGQGGNRMVKADGMITFIYATAMTSKDQ